MDFKKVEKCITCKKCNPKQFSALVSLAHGEGCSAAKRIVSFVEQNRPKAFIRQAFLSLSKRNGRVVRTLEKRRLEEFNLFSGSKTTTSTNSTVEQKEEKKEESKYSVADLDIKKGSTPNKSGRDGNKPDVIVCHITEGAYAGAVSWLSSSKSQASCHFVVSKKGEITQLVPIEQMSWCNGLRIADIPKATSKIVKSRKVNPNKYTVGIEHEGIYKDCKGCLTDVQKETTGKLMRHIANEIKKLYNIDFVFDRDHVIGHYEVDPVSKPNCPGQNFPFNEVIEIAKKTQ